MTNFLVVGSNLLKSYDTYKENVEAIIQNESDSEYGLIIGSLTGNDQFTETFGNENKLTVERNEKKLNMFDKRAGYMATELLIKKAGGLSINCQKTDDSIKGVVVAFWDNMSTIIKQFIELGKQLGLDVYVIRTDMNYTITHFAANKA